MSKKRDRERKPDLLAQNPPASAPSPSPAKPTGHFVRHSYDAKGELTNSDAA